MVNGKLKSMRGEGKVRKKEPPTQNKISSLNTLIREGAHNIQNI